MRKTTILLTIILASSVFCQCRKLEPVLDEINITLSATDNTGESDTKVAYATDAKTLNVRWESGDVLHLVSESEGYLGKISLKSGAATASGTFSGKVKAWTGTQKIHVYYLGTNPTIDEGDASCTLSIPSQDGKLGKTGESGGIARTYGFLHGFASKEASATVDLGTVNLSSLISIAYFDLSAFSSTVTCTSGYKSATLNMTSGILQDKTAGDITLNSPSDNYYMALIPGENQLLTFTDGSETAQMKSSKNFEAAKYYTLNDSGDPIPVGEATLYTIGAISDVSVTYAGGTEAITVQSYGQKGSEAAKAAPWKFQYYDETNKKWVDGYPSYISGTTSGSGSVTGESVNATVSAQTSTSGSVDPSWHKTMMQNNPYKTNYDLSLFNPATGTTCSRSTANCYMVNSPGSYKFPAVYGNAIKNGSTNSAAYTYNGAATTESYVLKTFVNHADAAITTPWIKDQLGDGTYSAVLAWKDETDLNISNLGVSDESGNMFVKFDVDKDNITPGNLVIALQKDGTVVWSWHIWFTDEDVSTGYQQIFDQESSSPCRFMPTNLGMVYTGSATGYYYAARPTKMRAVSTMDATEYAEFNINQEGFVYKMGQALGRSLFYQWGRKDPFPSGKGNAYDNEYSAKFADDGTYKPDLTGAADDPAHTIGEAIQNLNVFYPGKAGSTGTWEVMSNQGDWCGALYVNRWDADNCTWDYQNTLGEEGTKTIYDPCPVGFKVPHIGAFKKLDTFEKSYPFVCNTEWQSSTRSAQVKSWDNSQTLGWLPVSGIRAVYKYEGTNHFGLLYGCGVSYSGFYNYAVEYTTCTSRGATAAYYQYTPTPNSGETASLRTNFWKSIGGSVRPVTE